MSLDKSAPAREVSLRHAHAPGIDLPAPQPKPTSSSRQLESTVNLWDGGPTAAGVWECGPVSRGASCGRADGEREPVKAARGVQGEEVGLRAGHHEGVR